MSNQRTLFNVSTFVLTFVFISGCSPSHEELQTQGEQTAQGFAIAWQNEDYGNVYEYVIPELQSQRNKDEFTVFSAAAQNVSKVGLIYEKAVLQNNTLAYAYYTYNGEVFLQPKLPALEMRYTNGSWRINAFAMYFEKPCVSQSCDDLDVCTEDYCNSSTHFVCKHKDVENCCHRNSDCDSSKAYCRNSVCRREECDTNSDCKSPRYDLCANGFCIECRYDSDCPNEKVCTSSVGFPRYTCVECLFDSDCKDKGLCLNNFCPSLQRYPAPFILDGVVRFKLTVGEKAPISDVLGAIDIAKSLQAFVKTNSQRDTAISDNVSLDDLNSDAIIIGSPCVNKHAATILDANLSKCNGYSYAGFSQGLGIIKLIERNRHTYLLVSGYSPEDTSRAALHLANFQENALTGTELDVR